VNKVVSIFDKTIEVLIVTCVVLIIFLSCLNIALRWFELALTFVEPLVRHLVFMSAFLGAILAIGSDRHIKIDLMQKVIHKNKILKNIFEPIYFCIILTVLLVLSYSSYEFTLSELEYGKVEFLGIHSGFLTAIIPCGFVLMSFRHLLRLFQRAG
jgi:TRAP-type C4-dicarboxylate transport system permease small subunit